MQGTIFSTHLAFRAAEAVINYTILCIMTLCFELCLFPIATAATGNHDVVQEEIFQYSHKGVGQLHSFLSGHGTQPRSGAFGGQVDRSGLGEVTVQPSRRSGLGSQKRQNQRKP